MKQEISYDERKQWAHLLYTTRDITIRELAAMVNIDEASIRGWISEGAWESVKDAQLLGKRTMLSQFYKQITVLNAKIESEPDGIHTKEVELIAKYSTAIKNLETVISISQVIEVTELLMKWLMRRNRELGTLLAPQIHAFVKTYAH